MMDTSFVRVRTKRSNIILVLQLKLVESPISKALTGDVSICQQFSSIQPAGSTTSRNRCGRSTSMASCKMYLFSALTRHVTDFSGIPAIFKVFLTYWVQLPYS